jgi:hypothetical protein
MVSSPASPDKPGSPESHLHAMIMAGNAFAVARAYGAAGLSVTPVRVDGSKAPALAGWRTYSDRRPTNGELRAWFATPGRNGIGIPGGPASGDLCVFDFEAWLAFTRWGSLLSASDRDHLRRCPVVATPSGGAHVYARLTAPVKGCKYARDATGKCLIETRGNGHFVVAPGSPASCHRTGRPYQLIRLGWLDGDGFEPIPIDLFHNLTVHAVSLNEYVKPAPSEVVGDRATGPVGDRPGDHFNARVSWGDILRPHGWKVFNTSPGATYWTRPGKAAGISASTGFCTGPSGSDLLYVFSTSAAPFEAEQSYSRFASYALLNHRGNFRAATRALGLAGYGKPLPRVYFSGKAVFP